MSKKYAPDFFVILSYIELPCFHFISIFFFFLLILILFQFI